MFNVFKLKFINYFKNLRLLISFYLTEENALNELREQVKKREKQKEKKKRRVAAKLAQANVVQNGTATQVESICPVDEDHFDPPIKKNYNIMGHSKSYIFIPITFL